MMLVLKCVILGLLSFINVLQFMAKVRIFLLQLILKSVALVPPGPLLGIIATEANVKRELIFPYGILHFKKPSVYHVFLSRYKL